MARDLSWPASRGARSARKRAPRGAPSLRSDSRSRVSLRPPASSRSSSSWSSIRRGARRVLELLLGAEQRVEDLLAQTLAQCEGEPGAHERRRRAGGPCAACASSGPRSESAASLSEAAASFSSRCTFLSSRAFAGPLPLTRPYAFFAETNAVRRFSRSSCPRPGAGRTRSSGPPAGGERSGAGLCGLLLRCHGSPRIRLLGVH